MKNAITFIMMNPRAIISLTHSKRCMVAFSVCVYDLPYKFISFRIFTKIIHPIEHLFLF
jgi:hypothetical protein